MAHVTFIHGIANKPPKDQLIDIWIRSLARNDGPDLDAEGVTYGMVYWADVLYERPDDGSSAHESLESQTEGVPEGEAEDESWRQDLPEAERQFLDGLTSTLGYEEPAPGGDDGYEPPKPRESDPEANRFERIPVPWFIKRRLMKVLLRDVHHYLFNTDYSPRPGERFRVRDEIRRRFVAAVAEGASKPGPHIVLSHSMGTVIAYDCLKRVGNCAAVDALMTVGSPLGLDEIQDKLGEAPDPRWTRQDGFPSAKVQGSWVNVYDRLDPVCGFDPKLANDYERASQEIVRDLNEQNYGKWRHSIDKYLGQPKLQAALSDLLF
jgi:hypothetical protein